MLRFIEPADPVLQDEPPDGAGWIHEIKQDGFRTQLILENGKVKAFSRSGLDWTARYPAIVASAETLPATSAILDGEAVLPDEKGASDFHNLMRALKRAPDALQFVAFDLMHLDGEDLRQRPLSERRALLDDLLARADSPRLVFSRGFEGEGKDVFAAVEQLELEGIVSKRANGIYRSGAKSGWIKTKCFVIGTFDVIGVDKTPGGAPVALLAKDGIYVGQAFIALSAGLRDAFWRFIELRTTVGAPIKGLRRKGATWVSGGMIAKVKHLRGEEMLRHASVVEITLPKARASARTATTRAKAPTRPRAPR